MSEKLERWAQDVEWAALDPDIGPERLDRLNKLAAYLRDGGWLPIESAPKDGTPVLLFAETVHCRENRITVGWWDAQFKSEDYNEATDEIVWRAAWTDATVASWGMEETSELQPRVWRPLPAPPALAPPPAAQEGA